MSHVQTLHFVRTAILIVVIGCLGRGSAAAQKVPVSGQVSGPPPRSSVVNAVLPPFVASPFADEFVTTGAEGGVPGDHYVPSHGDGTFGPKSNIPGLSIVDGTDVADMDGDGDLDFVTCEGNTGNVFLYENLGAGSFVPRLVASGISTEFSTNLRIQDFDRDGRRDFVVGDNRNRLGTKVFLQAPGVTFALSDVLDTSWTGIGNSLFGVAVGDLDGDGNPDVTLLGYTSFGAGQVRFYSGDGTGAFGPPVLLFNIITDFGEHSPNGLAAFDLEGDGDLDLVVGGGSLGNHFIYTNDGTGSFTAPASAAFDVNGQTGVDAFDADHDGDHDLVVAVFGPSLLYYVQNLGGSLAAPVAVASLTGPSIGVGAPPLLQEIRVFLDVKPGSCPNPLNTKSKGVLPVAILGTDDFDVTGIDPATLLLEGVPALRWSLEDVGTPFSGVPQGCLDCSTGGPDGHLDLTLKFDTQAVAAARGPVSDRQCRVVRLTGNLRPGAGATPILGEDVLTILKK